MHGWNFGLFIVNYNYRLWIWIQWNDSFTIMQKKWSTWILLFMCLPWLRLLCRCFRSRKYFSGLKAKRRRRTQQEKSFLSQNLIIWPYCMPISNGNIMGKNKWMTPQENNYMFGLWWINFKIQIPWRLVHSPLSSPKITPKSPWNSLTTLGYYERAKDSTSIMRNRLGHSQVAKQPHYIRRWYIYFFRFDWRASLIYPVSSIKKEDC